MKVFVTGGAGYIGGITVHKLLEQGHEVTIFDNLSTGLASNVNTQARFIKGDVRDAQLVSDSMENFDAVFHFAALAIVADSAANPKEYEDTNVIGTLNILNAMAENKVSKIVFSSSCAVYGDCDTEEIDEDFPTNPINPYGHTKLECDKYLALFSRKEKITSFSLRFFNVAGAMRTQDKWVGESHYPETHLIPKILASRSDNPLQVFGFDLPTRDGTCVRDFIHVEDIANGFIKCLDKNNDGLHHTINLGSGIGTSIKEIIKLTEPILGRKISLKYLPRRVVDPIHLVSSNRKAKEILNWSPKISIEKIIFTAFEFFKQENYE
jgi:UDP-glucose 4-epimerase